MSKSWDIAKCCSEDDNEDCIPPEFDITVYESADRAGGHSYTVFFPTSGLGCVLDNPIDRIPVVVPQQVLPCYTYFN